jgi:hypothetical protein
MGFRGSWVQIPPSRLANTDAGFCPRFVFAIGTVFLAVATRLSARGISSQIPPSRLRKTIRINNLENERKRVSAHFLLWCANSVHVARVRVSCPATRRPPN